MARAKGHSEKWRKEVVGNSTSSSSRESHLVSSPWLVVKLFNVVQQAQTQAVVDGEEKKAARGSGKPSLAAPVIVDKSNSKKKRNKDNIIGRGKECRSSVVSLGPDTHSFQLSSIRMISLT